MNDTKRYPKVRRNARRPIITLTTRQRAALKRLLKQTVGDTYEPTHTVNLSFEHAKQLRWLLEDL